MAVAGTERSLPVANLVMIGGFGARGRSVVDSLQNVWTTVPDEQRLCAKLWVPDDSGLTLRDTTETQLLSQAVLDVVATRFQILGRAVGQRQRVTFLLVVDADDAPCIEAVRQALAEIASVHASPCRVACLVGSGDLSAIRAAPVAALPDWDAHIPFPAREATAGVRSDVDLQAAVARTLLLLAAPGDGGLLHGLATRAGYSPTARARWLRVGTAFLDARTAALSERLSVLTTARLLRQQFAGSTPAREPAPVPTPPSLRARSILKDLLGDTPFELRDEQQPWSLQLTTPALSVELQDAQPAHWPAVLCRLRDFLDYGKARRWRDAVDAVAARRCAEQRRAIEESVERIYRLPHAPEHLLAWIEPARDALEEPVALATPAGPSFESQTSALAREVRKQPEPLAVGSRLALLAALGAAAAYAALLGRYGTAVALGGVVGAIAIAAGIGIYMFTRAHDRGIAARTAAVAALRARYEVHMRATLLAALSRVRLDLVEYLAETRRAAGQLSAACRDRADAWEAEAGAADSAPSLVSVQWLVGPDKTPALLEYLAPPWEALGREAAEAGAFVPRRNVNAGTWVVPDEAVLAWARTYWQQRRHDLSLRAQLDFAASRTAGFDVHALVTAMAERSRVLAAGCPGKATWLGPPELLALTRDIRRAATPDATEREIELEMLACAWTGEMAPPAGGEL